MTSVQVWINIVLLLCVVSQYHVKCASSDVRLKLMKDLSKDQADNAYLRPVNDTNETVSVGFRFTPTISVLDESSQELQVRGMLVLTWKDYRLSWKPTEYDGIKEINMPLFKGGEPTIWKPELVLNESLVTDFQSFQPETTSVTLSHTGIIHWYTLATMRSFCMIVVRYYPFDKQTCHLTFTTWLYQNDEQTFYTIDDLVKNETYKKYEVKHGLWDINIVEVKAGNISYDCATCDGQEQSYVHYTLELTRGQPWLYFMNLLLPCIVMSVMTSITIWLPPKDDADAATFAMTCILALFVFLTFLFTILPSTGQPLIGYYIVWLIVEGVVVTVYTVRIARSLVTDSSETESSITSPKNELGNVVNQETSLSEDVQSVSYKVLKETPIDDTMTDGRDIHDVRPTKKTNNDELKCWDKRWRNAMIVVKVITSLGFFIMFCILFS